MPADNPVQTLPLPPTLALPLPAGAALRVPLGATVDAGATLAAGNHIADLIAPARARLSAIAQRPLASGGEAPCLLLDSVEAQPPPPLPDAPLPQLLKRAGIVGLGGGAYPAWRKWRRGLRWLIANGLETDPRLRHDAAQIAAARDTLTARVAAVAQAFAAAPLLALPPDAPVADHPIIRRLPPRYAIGSERLLIAQLCGVNIPPDGVPADYGIVCFNIATVLAMADAILDRRSSTTRVLSVQCNNGDVQPLRVPHGASVGSARRHLGLTGALIAGGSDDTHPVTDDAILTADITLLRPPAAEEEKTAMPCIRCGACDLVCPAGISPLQLYAMAGDDRLDDMAAANITHCIACRRCDDVCPSRLPLTATFTRAKRRAAARAAEQARAANLKQRHDAHIQRLQKPQPHITPAALKTQVTAALTRAKTQK